MGLSMKNLIDLNGASTCRGYFIPRDWGISFIVHLYLHFLCTCFLRVFFLHMVLLNMNYF